MPMTPRVIRLEQNGPQGAGLASLGLDHADFQSPLPDQSSHVYFTDPALGLNVGNSETTTMQEAFGPYPGDEFMLVLTGASSMLEAKNTGVPAKAGDLVAFRNRAPMSWKQDGYLKKFCLTLRQPEVEPAAIKTAEGDVVVIDPATEFTDDNILADSEGTGSGAVEREVILFTNDAGTMTVGLWDCQALDGAGTSLFPCHEFVVMAAGEVTIREPGGIAQTFGPGDAFFVPQGTPFSWHVPHYIRKFFAAVEA